MFMASARSTPSGRARTTCCGGRARGRPFEYAAVRRAATIDRPFTTTGYLADVTRDLEARIQKTDGQEAMMRHVGRQLSARSRNSRSSTEAARIGAHHLAPELPRPAHDHREPRARLGERAGGIP
jgi:hypothetical protein